MFRFFKQTIFKDFSYLAMMRVMWRYMGDYRRTYFLGLALLAMGIGVYLFEPYLMGILFNTIQKDFGTTDGLHHALFIALLIFLLEPLGLLLYSPGRVMEEQGGYVVKQNLVKSLYAKLQDLPYSWHQNFHSGQVFDRIRKAENAAGSFASSQFRYLSLIMNFVGSLLALAILFPWVSVACMVLLTFVVLGINKFDNRLVAFYISANKLAHSYAGVFSDYIANIRTIITLRLSRTTELELMHRYQLQKPVLWSMFRLSRWKWNFISFAAMTFKVGLIAIALMVFHKESAIKIGSLVMLIQYLSSFSNVFYSFGEMYQEIVKHLNDFRSIDIIDEAYHQYVTAEDEINHSLKQNWQKLEIRELDFAYGESERQVLDGITLDIHSGEKIALVGSSGSGKSTLLTILRGLYKADRGRVEIDGKSLPIDALSSFTTLIPQDPEIFENTIRYNITFGVEHGEEEILESCRMAGFGDVLSQLPQGLETDIREKGVNLSGGQKQRLALARGIFAIQESSLILLDEPTSSVDTVTEIRIFERLFSEFSEKSIIASIHRLHLLSRFDRIIMMDQGKIVEQGSLDQLIAGDGVFAKIWQEYQAEQNNYTR